MTKENDRLLVMLNENKISEEDYQLLSAAFDNKSSYANTIFSILINPFQKIAGLYALIAGIIIILCLSYLGVFAQVYFPGILDCLNASIVKNPKIPLNFYLLAYQNLIAWLVLTALYLTAAKIFQQKGIRIIDFFGTVALARLPFLILIAFLSILRIFHPSFLDFNLSKGIQLHPSIMMGVFSTVVIVCIMWQLSTYFFALKESSGLTGKKLWLSFFISLVLGEVLASLLASIFF